MAIRDRVRRALRKSEASDTTSSTESNSTTAHTSQSSNDGPQLQKTSSRLARALTFGSSDSKEKEKERAEKRASKAAQTRRRTHPRDRPLTSQNLRHQEMLAGFSMTFGASDPAQIETMSFVGVSPCCTRRGSLDLSRGSSTSFSNASSGTDSSREE
ncbi:hypothetical protein NHJ13051_005072 [Beauveria bassiana]|uniref:Uncharacterized protein n=1 Tax=Beauveria bassiana TaxID=176275 RepID=A0A2N6NE21_BEABA|nr:hypothetical protein BM221_008886 [Beauveria bassiana]